MYMYKHVQVKKVEARAQAEKDRAQVEEDRAQAEEARAKAEEDRRMFEENQEIGLQIANTHLTPTYLEFQNAVINRIKNR